MRDRQNGQAVQTRLLYHFTSTMHLPRILQDGLLRPSESNIGSPSPTERPYGDHFGPDVVWLLDSPERPGLHGVAEHGLTHSMVDKTGVRFTVRVPAIPWLEWTPALQMDPAWRSTFVEVGGGVEAAKHWFVFPAALRARSWVKVEDLTTGSEIEFGQRGR